MSLNGKELYEFSVFRLDVSERLLFRKDKRVALSDKAFEILCVLLRHPDHLVTKDELLTAVWPDTSIEENNIDKNISLLRKVLGTRAHGKKFIETVRGHGFRFTADVRAFSESSTPIAGLTPTNPQIQDVEVCAEENQYETSDLTSETQKRQIFEIRDKTSNNDSQEADKREGRFWLVTIAIAALAGLSFLGFYSWREAAPSGMPITSVAVLPFVNAGADPEMEYLSDGLTESLIDRLSELPQLKVIARSSSFKYRGENIDLQDAANKLGVQAIITGRVARRGDDLIIRVELIDAHDNKQLWGTEFNRKAPDALAIQAEIARTISGKLRLKLTGVQEVQLVKRGTDDPAAYELLLKGDYLYRTGNGEKMTKAIDYYQQAIALDPNYAFAYARIARTYGILANNSILDPKDVVQREKAAAQKAVELDENLADAYVQLANLAVDDWDWATAERGYVRALELNPNHSEAHNRYSRFLSVTGRHEEAIAEAKRGKELDPERLGSGMHLIFALLIARRFDESIAECKKILEIEPKYSGATAMLGYAYAYKGMYAEAVAKYLESSEPGDTLLSNQIFLGAAYAGAGERKKAQAILRRLETTKEYVSPGELSVLYTALGERERAFASLEKAYAAHDLQLKYLNSDPTFDTLRVDPRFQDLLRRVGLPQEENRY